MKRMIVLCMLLCLLLTACGHDHTGEWVCEPLEHRYTCEECGEEIFGAHETDEEGFCKTCGYTIYDNGDGTFDIMSYDAWGATERDIWVDESGTVLAEMRYENEYDSDGNVLVSKAYSDGVLINETFYEVEEGVDFFNHYITQEISYDELGKTVTNYNQYMYATGSSSYDADGNLISEDEYVYRFDDAGNMIYAACYSNGSMSYESAEMAGPDGSMYTEYLRYYSGGELVGEYTHEYEFSDEGHLLVQRDFVDGVLAVVGTFELREDGGTYLAKEVCYDESGAVTDEYHYDEHGNFIEE